MKELLLGIAFIVLVGIAGLLYRNATERAAAPLGIACSLDAKICPDGSTVGRVAPACDFAQCAAPNVTIASAGIVFALPSGFVEDTSVLGEDPTLLAQFSVPAAASSTPVTTIIVHDYPLTASSSVSNVLHATAIGDASEAPISPSAFSAVTLGGHTYTQAILGRFEGTVHVTYYLPRKNDVLRFDSLDVNIANWTDSNLDISTLPANSALRSMLSTIQIN